MMKHDDDIISAIRKDEPAFFNADDNPNWAMHKVKDRYLPKSCLSLAINFGAVSTFNKLLATSKYKVEELSDADIIGAAIECYYQECTKKNRDKTKIQIRLNILHALIQEGANPYSGKTAFSHGVFQVIYELKDYALFEFILNSDALLPLHRIIDLIKRSENKILILDLIIKQYGSLDLSSIQSSLLNMLIEREEFQLAKLLIQHGADVNFCGLARMSPLKLIETQIALIKTVSNNDNALLQESENFQTFLISKNALSFLNPYFNLSLLKVLINLKDISRPNRNWAQLLGNALKIASSKGKGGAARTKYLMSDCSSKEKINFPCSNDFIELCQIFTNFFKKNLSDNLTDTKFFKKAEKIASLLTEPYEDKTDSILITHENLPSSLKYYISPNAEYSSLTKFTIDLFSFVSQKLPNDNTKKKNHSSFYQNKQLDDQKFISNLNQRLTTNIQMSRLDIKREIDALSRNLQLGNLLQRIIHDLKRYLKNPGPYKTIKLSKV